MGPDRDKGKFRPLIFPELICGPGTRFVKQMDPVITTDHLAFYDKTEQQGAIRQTPNAWIHPQK